MSTASQSTIVAESGRTTPTPPRKCRALERCRRAMNRTYNKERANGESSDSASRYANDAFLRALPELYGHENVQGYIACINYAVVNDIIYKSQIDKYLSVAKIAIAALRQQPKLSVTGASSASRKNLLPPGEVELAKSPN